MRYVFKAHLENNVCCSKNSLHISKQKWEVEAAIHHGQEEKSSIKTDIKIYSSTVKL